MNLELEERLSSPGELNPKALADPYVNVSAHLVRPPLRISVDELEGGLLRLPAGMGANNPPPGSWCIGQSRCRSRRARSDNCLFLPEWEYQ